MPFNLLKKYPQLLEILHLEEPQRKKSLMSIYKRDIEDNPNFKFRGKQIYPIKSDGTADMGRQFIHLTCEEIQETDDNGKSFYPKRVFEKDRSQRLHWIKHHIDESSPENIKVFSVKERNQKKRCDVIKTYIYDEKEKYIIVLECQKKNSYYLLTAYYLNKPYAEKSLKKKIKKCLPDII